MHIVSWRTNRRVDGSNGSVSIEVPLLENWGGNCNGELEREPKYWSIYIV